MTVKEKTYYETRDGQLVFITHELIGEYPMLGYFVGKLNETIWTKDGSLLSSVETPSDLVKEMPKEKYPELYL